MTEKEKHAIVIGINYNSSNYSILNGCINDANNMKSFLETQLTFPSENITMMNDDLDITHTNYPNYNNIINNLTTLLSKQNSQLFITFSGHGGSSSAGPGNRSDYNDSDADEYLYATNSAIQDDTLRNLISNNLSTSSNLFIFIDACNSGTNFDLPHHYHSGTQTISNMNDEMSSDVGLVMKFSACSDSQLANEAVIDGKFQGFFTYNFLKYYNHDYTYKEFANKLNTEISVTQTPIIMSSRNDKFDDKLFSTIDQEHINKNKKKTNTALILAILLAIIFTFLLIYLIFRK